MKDLNANINVFVLQEVLLILISESLFSLPIKTYNEGPKFDTSLL